MIGAATADREREALSSMVSPRTKYLPSRSTAMAGSGVWTSRSHAVTHALSPKLLRATEHLGNADGCCSAAVPNLLGLRADAMEPQ